MLQARTPSSSGSAQQCLALHCEGPEPGVAKQPRKEAAQEDRLVERQRKIQQPIHQIVAGSAAGSTKLPTVPGLEKGPGRQKGRHRGGPC